MVKYNLLHYCYIMSFFPTRYTIPILKSLVMEISIHHIQPPIDYLSLGGIESNNPPSTPKLQHIPHISNKFFSVNPYPYKIPPRVSL